MKKHVMTVLGRVAPEKLGYTDAHNHVWIEPISGGNPDAPVLNDAPLIAAGLSVYRAAGGGAIIDCQPAYCGRNGHRLRSLSEASDVHIVGCTGFHLRKYYADNRAPLWSMSAEEAYAFFVDEIRYGFTETQGTVQAAFPGFIKIAAEATWYASPQHLFEAAAQAAIETGYAIEMHSEAGEAVEDFLHFFLDQGLSPTRLVFCHVDKRADFGLHQELAQAGVMLEYDTFYRPKYDPDHYVWELLPQIIDAGLAQRVALATDMAFPEMWQRPGLTAFFTHIKTRLQSFGIEPAIIRDLMGRNIANRLAIEGDPA